MYIDLGVFGSSVKEFSGLVQSYSQCSHMRARAHLHRRCSYTRETVFVSAYSLPHMMMQG